MKLSWIKIKILNSQPISDMMAKKHVCLQLKLSYTLSILARKKSKKTFIIKF